MTSMTRLTLATAVLAASVSFAGAQPAQDHDRHHPGDPPAQTPGAMAPGQRPMGPGAARPGGMGPGGAQGGPDMMMGGDMARMMAMMQMMRGGMMPMGPGQAAMRPLEHVEGQLAFFRTELKITEAQTPQWNAFADTIRDNAAGLRKAMAQAMEASSAATAPEQMERRIAMLSARLGAMQAVLVTAKPLYGALTDEQKKVADDLLGQHFMAMRAGGM